MDTKKENGIENLKVAGRDVKFAVKSGKIISVEKNVVSNPKGGMADSTQEVWLKTKDGKEMMSKIMTTQTDSIPLLKGHDVTIVEMLNKKFPVDYPAHVANHSTKSEHVIINGYSALGLGFNPFSLKPYLIGLLMFAALPYLVAGAFFGVVGFLAWTFLYCGFVIFTVEKRMQTKVSNKVENHIKEQLKLAEKGV